MTDNIGCASRMPDIRVEIDRLKTCLASFAEELDKLEKRLDPILRATPPTPAMNVEAPKAPAPTTPLGGTLRDVANECQSTLGRIVRLTNRVEV